MYGEIFYFYFLFLIFFFVLSMVFLVFRNSFFLVLVFWDFLGLRSFFLVNFYNNFDRINSSIITIFVGRLGDYFLFFFLIWGFFYFFLENFIFLVLVSGLTKRAQFPFIGWLPKAISAPTPVRALVHRSTLVTAGLFLFFFLFFGIKRNNFFFCFFLGLFSFFFSSFLSVFEMDLKKIVALRTLSQIGLCFLSFSFGFYFLSFFHLLSHAFFKSLLFLQVGYFMYLNFGQQNLGLFFLNLEERSWVKFQLLLSLFNLCGIFFFNGIIRKHYIIEFIFSDYFGFFLVFIYFFSFFLTLFYSFKLFIFFFIK
jgi:NADH:ubiquinone oxidoreductase subunit 5 (subunit L)/multisubunit Na+/H+ antiporter MnhA subunit